MRDVVLMMAFSATSSVVVALGFAGRPAPLLLTSATMIAAALTASYTAFLFGQAKGRDLWQSPLLGPQLMVQALLAGACLFAHEWLRVLLPVHGLLVAGEVFGRHATEDAHRAAMLIQSDPLFTSGVLAIGHLLPLALLWAVPGVSGTAASLALAGLLVWEHLYVQAPQRIPNA